MLNLSNQKTRTFNIRILGRMLELLGVQMYKKRDAAIAELIANSWDAGADNVWVNIPDIASYNKDESEIMLEDDGCGMDEKSLEDNYLVIGRNRREEEGLDTVNDRRIMGRKGIGKLAGFGIAGKMTVQSWKDNETVEVTLDLNSLNDNPRSENVQKQIEGTVTEGIPDDIHGLKKSGTRLILRTLKQTSPIDIDSLHNSLSRRFSRTVHGRMSIFINDEPLRPFNLDLHENSKKLNDPYEEIEIEPGKIIKYNYVFTKKPIREKELRGFTILVHEKTAQAPNFFFNREADGISQHSSKYLCGTIEADYLDDGTNSTDDIVSTDRQEINWERPETNSLWTWGRKKTNEIFEEIAQRNAEDNVNVILNEPSLSRRIENLDPESRKKVIQFVKSIGNVKVSNEDITDLEKIRQLGDQIIKAFEYRHFVDVIDDIENASTVSAEELQNLLNQLSKWEVLESRSILEVIKGRLKVIDKFYEMIINRAPETANRQFEADNFHDLIAGFPWLLNPEWQVFLEEKTVSTILKTNGIHDFPELMKNKRLDFLALEGDDTIAIIEIKSPGEVLTLDELRRLEDYKIAIEPAYKKRVVCVLIYSGIHAISKDVWNSYLEKDYFTIHEWKDMFTKNREYYEHYRAVLQNHVNDPNFKLKESEVKYTRKILEKGTVYRAVEVRKEGLGVQDMNYLKEQMKNITIEGEDENKTK